MDVGTRTMAVLSEHANNVFYLRFMPHRDRSSQILLFYFRFGFQVCTCKTLIIAFV